jgi:hypothetical protein
MKFGSVCSGIEAASVDWIGRRIAAAIAKSDHKAEYKKP